MGNGAGSRGRARITTNHYYYHGHCCMIESAPGCCRRLAFTDGQKVGREP